MRALHEEHPAPQGGAGNPHLHEKIPPLEQCFAVTPLFEAFYSAYSGQKRKTEPVRVSTRLFEEVYSLSEELLSGQYYPKPLTPFYVYEPKKRLIHAPHFTDKWVQMALCRNYLYDALTKRFIRDSYASQIGKGSGDALQRVSYFFTDYWRKHRNRDGWILKCDIKSFYASVDHNILKRVLGETIHDTDMLGLLHRYIDTADGLPLGFYSSQLLALTFLNELDHIIKEQWRVRWYGRYSDDFLLLTETKGSAKQLLSDISDWLYYERSLFLNNRTQFYPMKQGVEFLGFRFRLTETGKVMRQVTRAKAMHKRKEISQWHLEYWLGMKTKEQIEVSFQGWVGHAQRGMNYAFICEMRRAVDEIYLSPPFESIEQLYAVAERQKILVASDETFPLKPKRDGIFIP